jgi:3-phenylpropionate/trans-cinnamate dioxygenase ferredoxin reductase subunit
MIDDSRRVAVVGAGHSGTAAAALLRQHGFTGPLTLLGAERHVPYHRPPLSKSAQGSGSGPPDLLRPAGFYPDQRIELRLDTPVRALDPAAHVLHLGDGSELRYDVAILATGAWPRRIPVPGADLPGVHILRTLDDARRLGDDLGPGRRLVVVGGGYIGLEVASTARRLGTQVTVLEAAERVLGRSAGLDTSPPGSPIGTAPRAPASRSVPQSTGSRRAPTAGLPPSGWPRVRAALRRRARRGGRAALRRARPRRRSALR